MFPDPAVRTEEQVASVGHVGLQLVDHLGTETCGPVAVVADGHDVHTCEVLGSFDELGDEIKAELFPAVVAPVIAAFTEETDRHLAFVTGHPVDDVLDQFLT
jgi:hypothetical protein